MELKYIPQANNSVHRKVEYIILDNSRLKVIYNDGQAEEVIEIQDVTDDIEHSQSSLPFNPIVEVEWKGDCYVVTVIRLYDQDEKDKFELDN